MKKSQMHQTKVSTNLEKKTRQKIAASDDCGAADLLKDFKLLNKFKKCHVRVARLSKNTLGKIGKKKDKPQRKVRATLIRGGGIKKKPIRRGRPRKFPVVQSPSKTPIKTENQAPDIEEEKQKAIRSPENNKRNKEKKKRQIFIRLPFLETAKLKSLNKDLIEKHYKKAHPIKRLGKTYLTERFGSRFFRCHVKVARYRSPNDPAPKKKDKFNRKSVSFVETVEVFGESDDDLPQLMNSPRTSTPAQTTCKSSNDSIAISPSKRKVSLLKNTESPRSEHMRRSDEKVPRVKSVNTQSLESDTNKTVQEEEGEELPTVSGAEDPNEHESLNVDETEHEILPEDERVDEEDEEEEKESHKNQTDEVNEKEKESDKTVVSSASETAHNQNDDIRTRDENSQEMGDDVKDSIKEEDRNTENQSDDENVNTFETTTLNNVDQEDSHQHTEDDHEASNDLPREQMESTGNNNDSNHIELSPISDHDSNMFYDIVQNDFGVTTEPELFTEADDQEKEFSLQISNNSEISALCQKPEQNDLESDSVLSNLNNIDSILDDASDRPQEQQTKFSLNTFFKSLKTKIISQRSESIPPTKSSNQCTDHEGDQTLRDELTIK